MVSTGEYPEDYMLYGVFTSREAAERFISSFAKGGETLTIEEYGLNNQIIPFGLKAYDVRMDADGRVISAKHATSPHFFSDAPDTRVVPNTELRIFDCYCFATDRKHAISIAEAERQKLIK